MKLLPIVVGAVVLAGAALLWHPPPRPAWTVPSPAPSSSGRARWSDRPKALESAVVYVAGAVVRPGLYSVREGARAADAIRRAGGLRPDADAAGVNLAARVADGDEVEVGVAGQRIARSRSSGHRESGSSTHRRTRRRPRSWRGSGLDDPVLPAGGDAAAAPIDVNAADAQALAAVPGVGRSIAGRIVELRERVGPFATLDELLDVAGMTQSRLERARPFLRDP
jgi:competence protein ComEA